MDVKADDIPGMCLAAETFAEAVWIACASKRRSGRMHTHQTKVSIDARREFGWAIIDQYPDPGCYPATFAEFHDTLWEIRPPGIGALTTYDVATRVGAWLRIEPVHIYLHTGARLGWEALMGIHARAYGLTSRVPPERWPVPLRQLSADMAEDFLCTYRDTLKGIARNPSGEPI